MSFAGWDAMEPDSHLLNVPDLDQTTHETRYLHWRGWAGKAAQDCYTAMLRMVHSHAVNGTGQACRLLQWTGALAPATSREMVAVTCYPATDFRAAKLQHVPNVLNDPSESSIRCSLEIFIHIN